VSGVVIFLPGHARDVPGTGLEDLSRHLLHDMRRPIESALWKPLFALGTGFLNGRSMRPLYSRQTVTGRRHIRLRRARRTILIDSRLAVSCKDGAN
jgi:hypothetical protein